MNAGRRSRWSPFELFRSRAFTGANLLTLLLYGAMSGGLFFLPFNLMQVQGYTTAAAGAATLPFVVLIFALSRTFGRLVKRWGARALLSIGPLIAAAGLLLLAWPGIGGSYWTTFFPGIFVLGLGMAISVAPLTTTVMNTVDDRHVGIASGLNNAVARTSGLVAVALFNVLVAYSFDAELDRRLASVKISAAAREALDRERPKLAGAEAPTSLDGSQRDAVTGAIDAAFVHSFRLVMLVAAALAAGSAAIAAITLGPCKAAIYSVGHHGHRLMTFSAFQRLLVTTMCLALMPGRATFSARAGRTDGDSS